MTELLIVLVLLYLLGIVQIPWLVMPRLELLSVFGFSLTLPRLLIFALVIYLATAMGSPFRQMVWAFIVLWLLAIFGIVVIGNMLTLVAIAVGVGLILSAVQK